MRTIFCLFFLLLMTDSVTAQHQKQRVALDSSFSFVFMTDIHIKSEVAAAFLQVIDSVNKLKPDFVVTGGDLVFDVMRGKPKNADTLFQLYRTLTKKLNMPIYNGIGNHDLFGIYPESDVDSTYPQYKYGMYEKYIGKTYYSFNHRGWHFIVLNSIDVLGKRYLGVIGEDQMEWIKKDLAAVDTNTPIVVSLHIPLISVYQQLYPSKKGTDLSDVFVTNRNEVLDLFAKHNLKIVLQGHMHWVEDVFVNNKTHFITGGSVAGRPSWKGTEKGPRGFMYFTVRNQSFSWKYVLLPD